MIKTENFPNLVYPNNNSESNLDLKSRPHFPTTDSQANLTDYGSGTNRQQRRPFRLACYGVLIAAAGGLVTGLALYFTDAFSSESQIYEASIRIIGGPYGAFTPELQNRLSAKYKQFERAFNLEVDAAFSRSVYKNDYNCTIITEIRNGSVLVEFEVHLKKSFKATTNDFIRNVISNATNKDNKFGVLEVDRDSITSHVKHVTKQQPISFVFQSMGPNMRTPFKASQCVNIRHGICSKLLPYNLTGASALFTDTEAMSLVDMAKAINKASGCYDYDQFMLFFCTWAFPICPTLRRGLTTSLHPPPLPPCKYLCEETKRRCSYFFPIFSDRKNMALAMVRNCSIYPDSKDPQVCVGRKEQADGKPSSVCKTGETRCDGGNCIPSKWICDGYQDCKDNTDESPCAHCQRNEYSCPSSRRCIPRAAVCDGRVDCHGGADEHNCFRSSGDQEYSTNGSSLQVYSGGNQTWTNICADEWTESMSDKVCESMNFREANSTTFVDANGAESNFGKVILANCTENVQGCIQYRSGCHSNKQVSVRCTESVCGIRPAFVPQRTRVVKGSEVRPGTWPWLVSLHGGSGENFYCGGALIDKEWVLTAAHCLKGIDPKSPIGLTIRIGQTRRHTYSRHLQQRTANKVMRNPYYYGRAGIHSNDIALIHLSRPVEYNDYSRPVCMPSQDQTYRKGTVCYVAGWGRDVYMVSDYKRTVNEAALPIMDQRSCKNIMENIPDTRYTVTTKMLCAGASSLGQDACQGDSGSPLVCRDRLSGRWTVAGLVSWGHQCGVKGIPGIFTRVSRFMPWIHETIGNYTLNNN